MRKLLVIAGIPVDDLTMDEALGRVETFIASGQPHQIATVNVDFVVKAWDDPELRYILQVADMLTPDGMPLVWGARLLGVPLQGRVTGADMVPALAERGAQKGWRFYFLGARPGIAAGAAEILTDLYPGFQVVGVYSPPVSPVVEMDPALVDRIRQARPDVLLVAFGNPKQEKWIHMHLAQLGVPVAIGVGGTLDFIAGETRRAPLWMQRAGLEWLFRLLQEPRRLWRRYVVDSVHFARFFAWQWWMQRRGRNLPAVVPRTEEVELDGQVILSLSGSLNVTTRDRFVARAEAALARSPHLIINLADVPFIDSAGMGSLVGLTRRARAAGGDVRLAGASPQVRRTFELLRLDRFLTLDETLEESLAGLVAPEPGPPPPRQVNRWTVLPMPRRLDVESAAVMRAEGQRALEKQPYLVTDFSATEYLDSTGIATLLALHRQAQHQGGELRLAGMARQVRRTLELAGVAPLLAVYEDVKAAIGR